MVMERLCQAWGPLLIQHGAIQAIVIALMNTHHTTTLQQLSTTLSIMCQLHPSEGMPCLTEAVGTDLARALAKGYDPYVLVKLREEKRKQESSTQREPILNDTNGSMFTIRAWDP